MAAKFTVSFMFLSIFIARQTSAILCWDCNSAQDPRCGDDFNDHTLGVADCSQRVKEQFGGKEAEYCRKTTQIIKSVPRVIRGCGWLEDNRAELGDCYTRTGTKDVMVTYCQCKGNLCNSSSILRTSFMAFLPLLFIKLL